MKKTTAAALLAALAVILLPSVAEARAPKSFFGIAPQTELAPGDTARMRAGGIGTIRTHVEWSGFEREPGVYQWGFLDRVVTAAATRRLQVMPFIYNTPGWLSNDSARLPIDTGEQRFYWTRFLREAVRRYGPRGSFWAENPGLPRVPIRHWQIWNEQNFFYFTKPASPTRYATLLKLSYRAIKSQDRGAKVIMGGLFGRPDERPPRAMDAAIFLNRLYKVRGIKHFFDGVAVHPYAAATGALRTIMEDVREVIVRNRDPGAGLYITEIGWGSEPNFQQVAFEVGIRGQVRELTNAYSYLLLNRNRLKLKQVYWFSWKDLESSTCSFCDSVGLFRAGDAFRPKPAWNAFRKATSGRLERQARRQEARRKALKRKRARQRRARRR